MRCHLLAPPLAPIWRLGFADYSSSGTSTIFLGVAQTPPPPTLFCGDAPLNTPFLGWLRVDQSSRTPVSLPISRPFVYLRLHPAFRSRYARPQRKSLDTNNPLNLPPQPPPKQPKQRPWLLNSGPKNPGGPGRNPTRTRTRTRRWEEREGRRERGGSGRWTRTANRKRR